jgi:hypothetical protein
VVYRKVFDTILPKEIAISNKPALRNKASPNPQGRASP